MNENLYKDLASVSDENSIGRGNADWTGGIYPERRILDRLLTPFCVRCISAPINQLVSEIEKVLKEVNTFFESDRVSVWELSEDAQ